MTLEQIQDQLCREIETLCAMKKGSVTSATDLTKLGIDSLKFVSLLLVIEQKFGVSLMKTGLKPDDTKSSPNFAAAIMRGRGA